MSDVDQTSARLMHDVTQFIYREARLQDQHDYDGWEALWSDDGVYWVPANGEGGNPEDEMSIIYDNRSRISLRVSQLKTGRRFSQTPVSQIVHMVSNIEILKAGELTVEVCAASLVYESHVRGQNLWGARTEYSLRKQDGQFRMARKKVVLANNRDPLLTMAFLI